MSEAVKSGDTISVHYTGKFENDVVFDSSEGRTPLKFTVGKGQLIPGFDTAVAGMKVGEKKTVIIAPEDGYGPRMDERMMEMPKENVPENMDLKVGMAVQLTDQAGNPIPAIIAELTDGAVKLDLNHPLAGKTLVFDIEIREIGLTPNSECGDTPSCGGGCCGGCN